VNCPLRCRLFGHKYAHTLVYGAESLGYVEIACTRRYCTHVYATYTMRDYAPTRGPVTPAEMRLAAQVRIKADRVRGVDTPQWIRELAK
jgi:hypothetical protein